jgi:rubrerythrin
MQTPNVISELSRLYALEVDAVHAYSNAVAILPPGPVRDEVAIFGLEHQRHALVLQELIVRRGYNPPAAAPDVKGVVIGALTAPRRPLSPEDVLEGLRGNEQLTSTLYAKALAKGLPDDVREPLSSIHAEERRHLDWVQRAVSRRAWEADAASP